MKRSQLLDETELFSHVLREQDDNSSRAVWLPGESGHGHRDWERILNTSGEPVRVEGMHVIPAAIDVIREPLARGWLAAFLSRWRNRNKSESEFSIPNGSTGIRIGSRRHNAVLVLTRDDQELDDASLRQHWPTADRFEPLGRNVWLVVGVAISADGRIVGSRIGEEVINTADAIAERNPTTTGDPSRSLVASAVRPVSGPPRPSMETSANPPPMSRHDTSRKASANPRASRTEEPPSRLVRVFVSSTFRDMKSERDHLMADIFPMLRKLCEQRGLTWGVADFRWGITKTAADEKQVPSICLREVARCDYFIGLLGERYGWIPKPEDMHPRFLEEHAWLQEYQQRSLTEMEIAYGALREPPAAKHAFFYRRDPEHVKRLPEGADPADFQTESTAAKTELDRFWEEIREAHERGACHLRSEQFRNVEELGEWVLEDFRALIESLYPEDGHATDAEPTDDVHLAYAKSRAAVYVARQADFDRLKQHVEGRDPPLVVLGESGVGKSALLANYFLKYRERPDDFCLIHFIGCTRDSSDEVAMMRRVMVELKRHFQLPDDVPFMPDQIRDGFRQWLANGAACGRIVLIIDGLDQLHDHDRTLDLDWLPINPPPNCRVILSTLPGRPLDALRRREWPNATVEPLDRAERAQLLQDYLDEDARNLDEWAIDTIVKADQTANPLFLRSMLDELRRFADHDALRTRIPEYLQAENPRRLFLRLLDDWKEHFVETVVTDGLSLLHAARHGLSEEELLDLLGSSRDVPLRAAWSRFYFATESIFVQRDGLLGFSHDYIRGAVELAFLQNGTERQKYHTRLAVYFSDRRGRYLTDRMLDELGWQFHHCQDWPNLKDLLVDREVFVRLRATERGKADLQRYWLALAKHLDPCKTYAKAAAEWERHAVVVAEFLNTLNELGIFHYERAEYSAAEPLMRRALAIAEQLGEKHPQVAAALNNLALLLRATNRLAEAEPLFRRALAIGEQSLGPDHPDVALALNNLASLLQATNRLAEAERLFRRALAIGEQSLGPDHPDVALALNNLAELLQATNRLAEAERLFRRALAIREQSYGPDHPEVATILNNLALLLQATNRLAEAEPLYRRALAIDEQSYGPEHPKVARDLNNLALLLQATNRLAEAEPLYRRALAIDEQSYGPDNPNVATNLNNLAGLLRATNRLAEAEPLFRRALAIDEQSLGPDNPNVATNLNNLAGLLQATNRLAEAEPLFRRALAIDERSLGPDHPKVARDLNNLALLLQATNRLAEAEPLCRRALAIDEQSYGADHPKVARDLNNLALLLQATNRLAEAEPLCRRALAIDERSLGPDHPAIARDLNNLAALLQATNRLAEAEPLFRRALAIGERSFGPDHPEVATGLHNLAELLQATNRLAEAEPLCRRVVEIFLKFTVATGHPHPHLQQALGNYGRLLQQMGRSEDEARRELNDLRAEYGMSPE